MEAKKIEARLDKLEDGLNRELGQWQRPLAVWMDADGSYWQHALPPDPAAARMSPEQIAEWEKLDEYGNPLAGLTFKRMSTAAVDEMNRDPAAWREKHGKWK